MAGAQADAVQAAALGAVGGSGEEIAALRALPLYQPHYRLPWRGVDRAGGCLRLRSPPGCILSSSPHHSSLQAAPSRVRRPLTFRAASVGRRSASAASWPPWPCHGSFQPSPHLVHPPHGAGRLRNGIEPQQSPRQPRSTIRRTGRLLTRSARAALAPQFMTVRRRSDRLAHKFGPAHR